MPEAVTMPKRETTGGDAARYNRLVKAQRNKRIRNCWLCGQPIKYNVKYPDPDSFSYDHALPWSTHPHLRYEPSNGRSAHLNCNQSRGNRDPQPSLGVASEAW
jgi:5-methylcytosine-specific restriction endonuclease McrA